MPAGCLCRLAASAWHPATRPYSSMPGLPAIDVEPMECQLGHEATPEGVGAGGLLEHGERVAALHDVPGTVVYLHADERRALKMAAAERDCPASEIMQEALRAYLGLED